MRLRTAQVLPEAGYVTPTSFHLGHNTVEARRVEVAWLRSQAGRVPSGLDR
jgi:hypothetical protein